MPSSLHWAGPGKQDRPEIEEIFNAGMKLFTRCNTAYPVDPSLWRPYSSTPDLRLFREERELGFYIHVPFCDSLCRFCQYVRVRTPDRDFIDTYIKAVNREIMMYRDTVDLTGKTVTGFDLGGGTPTVLDASQIETVGRIAGEFMKPMKKKEGYNASVEAPLRTAASDGTKLKALRGAGFTMLSLGLQTVSGKLLCEMGRDSQIGSSAERAFTNAKKAGFDIINLDLMYGLPGEDRSGWAESVKTVTSLMPEHVSIYEARYNDTEIRDRENEVNWESTLWMYDHAHEALTAAGYRGEYGTSAYTLLPSDRGLSSYLQSRTEDYTAYIGTGAGSQSMTGKHISYNAAKSDNSIEGYIAAINDRGPFQDFYILPPGEILAKYLSVSFYFGDFFPRKLEARTGICIEKHFREELEFLKTKNFIRTEGGRIFLTGEGYRHYHGIVPLFYSPRAKSRLLNSGSYQVR